jgi:hypothetical protein
VRTISQGETAQDRPYLIAHGSGDRKMRDVPTYFQQGHASGAEDYELKETMTTEFRVEHRMSKNSVY